MADLSATGTVASASGIPGRLWHAVAAAWAAVTGIAPHVLHHVGPLAGTALVAGAGGQVLFGVVGFLATIPMLLKLRRRFNTWVAPAIALSVLAVVFSISTFVIGPQLSGADDRRVDAPATDHDAHGHGTSAESTMQPED